MDKDAAFQDLQTKNQYLKQQLEQLEQREQVIAQKAVTTSAVRIFIVKIVFGSMSKLPFDCRICVHFL